ncbi:hypothetical protein Syun_018337 [Stephania yunnanensis]|uniref:Uncharacterized protein n=1 Tax=Stephania yunnanensis TaxID=152371 RepID=A0AAP0IT47_9MAGN
METSSIAGNLTDSHRDVFHSWKYNLLEYGWLSFPHHSSSIFINSPYQRFVAFPEPHPRHRRPPSSSSSLSTAARRRRCCSDSGIDGPGVTRLIYGTRIAGMSPITRKEDKVKTKGTFCQFLR